MFAVVAGQQAGAQPGVVGVHRQVGQPRRQQALGAPAAAVAQRVRQGQ